MNITSQQTDPVHSPLSALPPKKIRELSKSLLLEQLELYYHARPPAQIVESDYTLWRCAQTGLEFAWPMLPGNTAFYQWVSRFESYYPGIRWEYGEVRRLMEAKNPRDKQSLKILDVGCGKGDFLQELNFIPARNKFALDLNEAAVQACRQQGFQAFCGTVETATEAGFLKAAEFSVVTSFHYLEHVSQPVDFVRTLMRVASPNGRVLVSTPYSPMSFETDWFDIMNHPPHHMTRWNLDAYRRLADILGAKMRWFVPKSGPLRRALGVFRLKQYGPNCSVSRAKLLKDLTGRLPSFLRLYRKQMERTRTSPVGGADTILVELTAA